MQHRLANVALAILILGLVVLHQDYWQWNNATLVFGFLPYQLAYHAGLSLMAALVWLWAVQFCWPRRLADGDAEKINP